MKKLVEQARDLMRWADEYEIDEISVSDGEDRIKISRGGPPPPPVATHPGETGVTQQNLANPAPATQNAEKPAPEEDSSRFKIVSPMVGTFYISPSPELSPFKSVGDKVNRGDTVCIVEAMKVMNQIKTPQDGILKKVLVKNAEVVYKGQVLMEIG